MDGYKALKQIAKKAMSEKGLSPEFPSEVLRQLEAIHQPAPFSAGSMADLRNLLWCSIDNDDSRDLDQLTTASPLPDGGYSLAIAIADVDALVPKATPIDFHAQINTTSVYTPARIFPMLPEKLSTNLTSLNEEEERAAVIFEIILDAQLDVTGSKVYQGYVKNYAKLTYNSVGAWLEGRGEMPTKVSRMPDLADTLVLQNRIAQKFKKKRHESGALTFETYELKPLFEENRVVALRPSERNLAHELIENLMIAANTASAHYALLNNMPSLRRVVRVPARWDRIVDLAKGLGEVLPLEPDSKALDIFLKNRKQKDPDSFPDLSLAIIKLLGSGEYVVEIPGSEAIGHFGLAIKDYTHSTAPNRRYPDLITQRILKSSLNKSPSLYSVEELDALARRCTKCEDAATKVERKLKKCAAAMLLVDRIGEQFEAIVTGAAAKGTWVRLKYLPIEGKLVKNIGKVDVGDRIKVELIHVDVDEGFIDFKRIY